QEAAGTGASACSAVLRIVLEVDGAARLAEIRLTARPALLALFERTGALLAGRDGVRILRGVARSVAEAAMLRAGLRVEPGRLGAEPTARATGWAGAALVPADALATDASVCRGAAVPAHRSAGTRFRGRALYLAAAPLALRAMLRPDETETRVARLKTL